MCFGNGWGAEAEGEGGGEDVLGHEGGVKEVDGVDADAGCLGRLGGADYDEDSAADK